MAERYQIIRPLAQGGFGKTFLACDRYLPGRPYCVIKRLCLINVPDDERAATFKTAQRLFNLEAETLYQLGTHAQIPTLLAHFEQSGEFYLVQDYIPGNSLQEEFAQEKIRDRIQYTQSLLQDLLTVLTFVQQKNVIHRDIKPANIIRRNSDRQLVLIDFGAVKKLNVTQASLTVAIGSPSYMAPEQRAGRPCFASDLYAVGMVGLQALTGLAPRQLLSDPSTGRVIFESGILESGSDDHLLLTFLNRLTQREPCDRFPDAASALQALGRLVNDPGALFPPTRLPPAKSSQIKSSRTFSSPILSNAAVDAAREHTTVLPRELSMPRELGTVASRNRQALLNKVHRFWIQGVLEHSLHGQVLLTLGLEERTAALALPWNITVQTSTRAAQPLASETRVFDVFQQLGEGRSLLILGEPGAGKTTTLLTLARDLLQQANDDPGNHRIPAIFNLSSWTKGPIDQWLIVELNSKYQVPKAIGQTWVRQQQLLLLLDGLDEVRPDRQDACAAAINQFHQDYGPELVVCCRLKDYEALNQRLGFQSALVVRSLTNQQIWQYLDHRDTGLTGLKALLERSVVDSSTSDSSALLTLARSPLILNIMALTYQGVSVRDIPSLQPGDNYTDQLFSAYIERMFERRSLTNTHSSYSKQKVLRWLQTLATHLTTESQTVFLIERMQVDWLTSRRQRWVFGVLVWAVFLVSATVIGFQVVSPQKIPLAVIISGILFVRIFGLYRIVPAETLRWSWQKASRSLWLGLTIGPVIGWLLKVGFTAIFTTPSCLLNSFCFRQITLLGLAFGTVLGVTYGVIRGFSGDRIATVIKPNQGIRQSAKNALLFAVIAAITPLLTAQALGNTSPAFWAAAGLSFGLALGGGEACVKHGVLRLILFFQGRIPWNYAHFLDYAAERIFLQKVGGGYIFIHRLLLEHFASLPLKK